ncbi:hypothetical protein CF326_g6756 [Tilletia indica]|nr:hypothetical protein CF326_g6756 [Tilletia indica]
MPTWEQIAKAAADLAGAQARLATLTARRHLQQQEVEILQESTRRADQEAQEAEALAVSKRMRADAEAAALHEKTADLTRLQQDIEDTHNTIEDSSGVLHQGHRMRMFQDQGSTESDDSNPPPPNKIRFHQCETCGTANSPRFRRNGTLCNACFLKAKQRHQDEDEDEFNHTLDL